MANKRKLEVEKSSDVWSPKKRKWTKPASQVGCKALAVRDIFFDMKDTANGSADFKSCVKFAGICEELLKTEICN